MLDQIIFHFFAALAIVSAILVVTRRNVVQSAIFLITALLATAGIFLQLHAEFLFIVQIILYAGGIMVLFVFVIMLLNAGAEEGTGGSRVALLFGVPGMLLGAVLMAWVLLERSGTQAVSMGALPGPPKTIGWLLFHDFLLPFEVTSVLVLIAIMGAVVLASHPQSAQQRGKES
jgi:NADH-quinone oxidoreductase subunit J